MVLLEMNHVKKSFDGNGVLMDKDGRRCPLANDLIHFDVEGPAEWRGGILNSQYN